MFLHLFLCWGWAQDLAYQSTGGSIYEKAHYLAFEGNLSSAKKLLEEETTKNGTDTDASALLARIYSWEGNHAEARKKFNRIISEERKNTDVWISAVKNELYANNDATALGLANKALFYLGQNREIERLKELAVQNIRNKKYPPLGPNVGIATSKVSKKGGKRNKKSLEASEKVVAKEKDENAKKKPLEEKEMNNRIGIMNSFMVFDKVYEPMVFSNISYRRQTLAGSIIPRINYNNRLNKHGIQYDLDFYPKFSKRFYAYLNYGYSNASIFPNHKVGGDLYANLPGAFEFSAGARYISFETKNVTVITNSLGHYRGNYYFSLRSYITPQPNNLTRISGNLLVRKYFRDGENFLGVNVGMGYSPELRQLRDGDELLAETLLYIESQRMSLQYQFTPKKSPNIYMANLGVARQELSFDTGNFFWSVTAGITYSVKF
ncbi:YaiO family outer membrane beta-barrel protein [Flavobacteriaceae bacterium TP-CH-4]|uniref:YaiO family outer membrane beta-barrel protein n=1 Tax=Pelagihabitans pacificus TaxID=2696054 RepID=A0A967EDZ5_9FLAO|nr:YaiO family outer membrane beta-barrel protein [Pelagihabitans pacificus]